MRRFRTRLEGFGRSLSLPEPQRGRLLEELAADLEDLYHAYRSAGLTAGEAERRALERLLPGETAAAELARLHRTLYVRVLTRIAGNDLATAERVVLGVLAVVLLAVAAAALPLPALLHAPSPFLLPVLGLGCGALLVALWCSQRLFLSGRVCAGDAGRGLGLLLLLLLAAPYLAVLGMAVDFYRAAGAIAEDPATATAAMVRLLRSDGILLLSALQLSLAGGVWWLALRLRAVDIRAAATAFRLRSRLVVEASSPRRGVA
jgi:hypothetical protein